MTPPRRKSDPPRRAVAYIRVSSDQQAESGLSLEHQREKVRAAAVLHDFTLQSVIVDAAESAATLERPGMRRVLELVKAKKVDAVIVLKLDRLTRNVRDLADLLELFSHRKVALMSVSESLNTETAAGRMVVNMLAVIAQWEREAIGERTSAALSAKRNRGERAGAIPYGFALAADGQRLKASEKERKTLRLMIDCREAGYSLRETAAELNRKGFMTRAGQPWRFEYVRSAYRTFDRHPGITVA